MDRYAVRTQKTGVKISISSVMFSNVCNVHFFKKNYLNPPIELDQRFFLFFIKLSLIRAVWFKETNYPLEDGAWIQENSFGSALPTAFNAC